MKLTLITYQSIVTHCCFYLRHSNVVEFTNRLLKKVDEFSKATGVKKESVCWVEVTESNCHKNMIFIYAEVPTDWQPTNETYVCNESYDENWYPNHVQSLGTFLRGSGYSVNIIDNPAENPHNLFRSKKI